MLFILEVLVGIILGGIIVYLIWNYYNKDIITYKKTIEHGRSKIVIIPNTNLAKITIEDVANREKILLIREDIGHNEKLEFIYPLSLKKAKITIDDGKKLHNFSADVS